MPQGTKEAIEKFDYAHIKKICIANTKWAKSKGKWQTRNKYLQFISQRANFPSTCIQSSLKWSREKASDHENGQRLPTEKEMKIAIKCIKNTQPFSSKKYRLKPQWENVFHPPAWQTVTRNRTSDGWQVWGTQALSNGAGVPEDNAQQNLLCTSPCTQQSHF